MSERERPDDAVDTPGGEPGSTDEAQRTRRRPRWVRWLEAAFWIGLAGVALWRLGPQIGAAVGIDVGTPERAPALTVTTIEGDSLSLADLHGQVVLVNFWATWCGPCRVEMPGFQDVYESRRERGFTIVGLSTDRGTPDLVRAFVRQYDIAYPIAVVGGEAERAFGGVSALPTSFLIDRAGCIRHTVRGYFAEAALAAAVDRLLDEPPDDTARPCATAAT